MVTTRAQFVIAVTMLTLPVSVSEAQQLLRDDFNGSGIVDPRVWRLPFGDSEGTFNGRTLYRGDPAVDLPLQGIVEPSASDGLVMELELDTYSPSDPGNQFLGTDLLTKRNFARGGGLAVEARLRLKPTTAEGLVHGFFLFDVVGDDIRDEIDWELLGNEAVAGGSQDPYTNYWNDGVFGDPGPLASHDVPNLDLNQFQTYRIEWTPQSGPTPASISWFVNNLLVRSTTTNVPNDPMNLHLNLWAPDASFGEAYNASLIPTAVESANENYKAQVDWVEVNRIDTTATELLTDGSFETTSPCSLSGNGAPCSGNANTTTDEWIGFNNVFLNFGDTVTPSDGFTSILSYGPFFNLPNASGLFQNVTASEGQEFEASVMAHVPSFDSIRPNPGGDFNNDGEVGLADYTVWRDNLGSANELPNDTTDESIVGIEQYELWKANFGQTSGTSNFTEIVIEFRDATGETVLGTVSTPIFDGRDPNVDLLEDEWIKYTVNGLAPAGTAFARFNLFFQQSDFDAGAVFFDEASLLLLEPTAGAAIRTANVPEPTTVVLAAMLLIGCCLLRQHTAPRLVPSAIGMRR